MTYGLSRIESEPWDLTSKRTNEALLIFMVLGVRAMAVESRIVARRTRPMQSHPGGNPARQPSLGLELGWQQTGSTLGRGLVIAAIVVFNLFIGACANSSQADTASTLRSSTTTSTGARTTTTTPSTTTRSVREVPTGLATDEIGVIGHSSVGTFIKGYRQASDLDLLTATRHGGLDVATWGDPANPGHDAAWSKVIADEPDGGYRAFWVMPGFYEYVATESERQAWADHIHSQIISLFQPVEYVWWSPMTTYFATNPGDGDAQDLVDLVPWPSEWPEAPTIGPRQSIDMMIYALDSGYADDYGPWINLTEALTDEDRRHPSEPPAPEPTGQSHGGDLLIAFFDG